MSEVSLVIRDAQRDISARRHGGFADQVIAALSAEPETIEELERALERFIRPGEWSEFRGFSNRLDDEPWDAGVVVIDLAARLIVCESTYSMPSLSGSVPYRDRQSLTDTYVDFHLPDDWKFWYESLTWRSIAEQRRRERAALPPLDARAVLYGQPLLKFIAAECLSRLRDVPPLDAAPNGERDPAADAEYDTIKQIHADWLLTSRDDLRGQSPREVLHARHDFIDRDLQDRAQQWSQLDECPRGLDPESHAYRFPGFGTHEMVLYYELVRALLWSCRDAVAALTSAGQAAYLLPGDFPVSEVPRLEAVREEWLHAPQLEHHGRSARSIIDNERRRIPEAVSGREAMADPDCPCCQMMADMPGPVFWHLDGCNQDHDFAFSIYCRTREEWDAEQQEWADFDRRYKEREQERQRLGVEYAASAEEGSIWSRSFATAEAADVPIGVRLFGIGANLAELIADIKEQSADRTAIDALSRDFGNLRDVLSGADEALSDALFDPVLARFGETLDAVAEDHPDLAEKCRDLQSKAQRLLEPPSADGPIDCSNDLPF